MNYVYICEFAICKLGFSWTKTELLNYKDNSDALKRIALGERLTLICLVSSSY